MFVFYNYAAYPVHERLASVYKDKHCLVNRIEAGLKENNKA